MTAPWMPPLPEPPAFYRYQFSSFYGDVWRSDHREWNGHTPKATEGLYTADQMRARDAEVARAALEHHARVMRNELVSATTDQTIRDAAAWFATWLEIKAKEITP